MECPILENAVINEFEKRRESGPFDIDLASDIAGVIFDCDDDESELKAYYGMYLLDFNDEYQDEDTVLEIFENCLEAARYHLRASQRKAARAFSRDKHKDWKWSEDIYHKCYYHNHAGHPKLDENGDCSTAAYENAFMQS